MKAYILTVSAHYFYWLSDPPSKFLGKKKLFKGSPSIIFFHPIGIKVLSRTKSADSLQKDSKTGLLKLYASFLGGAILRNIGPEEDSLIFEGFRGESVRRYLSKEIRM
jgi:hypothetical protein